MHPYEIAQTLRARAKHESIRLNYGSLYTVVEALHRQRMIQPRETVREGRRPERTVYEITEVGIREMADWMTDLLSTPVKEYPQFEAGLSFLGALAPDDAVDAFRQREGQLEWQLANLRSGMRTSADMGLPRLFRLETEYEERLVAAELDFVRALIADIDKGTLEGLDFWRAIYAGDADPSQIPQPHLPEEDNP
jgi:DNA-binding PadR family transcriptional regulator